MDKNLHSSLTVYNQLNMKLAHCTLYTTKYSQTSRKQSPKMWMLGARLREVVANESLWVFASLA